MNNQETVDALAGFINGGLYRGDSVATIAAEVTRTCLVIDRAELSDVTEGPDDMSFMVGGWQYAGTDDPARCRRTALKYLAAAEHLEQRDTVEAKREERHREIYVSLGGHEEDWAHIGKGSNMARAVDRIIALEDGTP